MRATPRPPPVNKTNRSAPDADLAKAVPSKYECYCGLGPACPLFRTMTPEQRVCCTRDKRQQAQSWYRNGVTH